MKALKKLTKALLIVILGFTITYAGRIRIIGSETPLGMLNAKIIFLADQLENNLQGALKGMPTVVSTFVNVNNFNKSDTFGRILTEALIHELQVRGWNVKEIRLTRDIRVNRHGEFTLSRNSKRLRYRNVRAALIVTGTYFLAGNAVVVNARVISTYTGRVVSTAQAVIPISGIDELFVPDTIPLVKIDG